MLDNTKLSSPVMMPNLVVTAGSITKLLTSRRQWNGTVDPIGYRWALLTSRTIEI